MKKVNKSLYFPKRVPEPRGMEEIEQKAFELFSKKNYKRWHIPLVDNLDNFIKEKPKKILEVGCGPGLLLKELSKKYPEAEIFGIDIQESALKLARENNKKSIIFKIAKAEDLPFHDRFFDLVISKDSFHEYSNAEKALSEMHRITKMNGIIYVKDIKRDVPMYLLRRVINPKTVFEKLMFYSARASYTKDEMKKLLKRVNISNYVITTRKITKQMEKKYARIGIEIDLLKESFQSRFVLIIKK